MNSFSLERQKEAGVDSKKIEDFFKEMDFHSYISKEFMMKLIGKIKGYCSEYVFADVEFAILTFCNGILPFQ